MNPSLVKESLPYQMLFLLLSTLWQSYPLFDPESVIWDFFNHPFLFFQQTLIIFGFWILLTQMRLKYDSNLTSMWFSFKLHIYVLLFYFFVASDHLLMSYLRNMSDEWRFTVIHDETKFFNCASSFSFHTPTTLSH